MQNTRTIGRRPYTAPQVTLAGGDGSLDPAGKGATFTQEVLNYYHPPGAS